MVRMCNEMGEVVSRVYHLFMQTHRMKLFIEGRGFIFARI